MNDKLKQQRISDLHTTWNYLRNRIANSHPARRLKLQVYESIDKEFRRLARAIYSRKLSVLSYKVIQFGNIDFNNGWIDIRSRSGFTVRLKFTDIDIFSDWAFSECPEKEVEMKKMIKIGNSVYETYKTDSKGNRIPKQAHEIAEDADKLLNGDDAGDI
ncbi:hypothetical protein SUREIYA_00800 [Serratia phage vB_SmaM-Sureiya]|nr:hypothetical protein SUREIYA_00800 [Serratia phage vB_SmaM-Sureiya]